MVSWPARPWTCLTTSEPPRRGWRRLLARRSVWVAIGPWCGFLFLIAACSASLRTCRMTSRPSRTCICRSRGREPGSRRSVDWALGVIVFGMTGLRMALACVGRAAAGGADRPCESRVLPWPVHRAGFRRLALRQFLGGHVLVAELFLRFPGDAPDRRGGGPGGDQRLCAARSRTARCGVASCFTRCWWPGCSAWP